MRYLSLLLHNNPNNSVEYADKRTEGHIYDSVLYEKYGIMTRLYKTDNLIQSLYRKLVVISHPFEIIKTEVSTRFLPKERKMKITNAYMKMWEFLKWADENKYINIPKDTLTMYDVAGAPGMFVIATDNYLQKYYPNVKLDWSTCSLEGGTALTDVYGLYTNNKNRYTPCDVLKPEDIKKCISKNKYYLVTGDIGIYHEDNYDVLQEEMQLDLEWGQMVLALNNVKTNGIMFLKMYSMVTLETIYLLDTLSKYFEHIMITKPYCTRIFNDESYIVCVNRNSIDCSNEPLVRPYIEKYTSPNIQLVKSFEYSRLEVKYRMLQFMKRVFETYGNKLTIESFKRNTIYKIYYDEFKELFDLFDNFDL